jgi:hypothetical protein
MASIQAILDWVDTAIDQAENELTRQRGHLEYMADDAGNNPMSTCLGVGSHPCVAPPADRSRPQMHQHQLAEKSEHRGRGQHEPGQAPRSVRVSGGGLP